MALTGVLLTLGCGARADSQEAKLPPAPTPSAAPAGEPTLHGVDFSPLTAAQKATAMKIFAEQHCNCGCGMDMITCRTKDQTCPRSPELAAQTIKLLAAGKSEAEVVKAVYTAAPPPAAAAAAGPTAPEMVFDVPAGDSYDLGPDTAPVTLVSFLDYQ
jgi:hypothetical protein